MIQRYNNRFENFIQIFILTEKITLKGFFDPSSLSDLETLVLEQEM